MRHPTLLTLTLALLLPACGARQSSAPAVAPVVAETADAQVTAAADASPWQGLGRAELSALVTADARRRLVSEGEPGFDAARLADYVAHPDQAPELSGKRCDRLLDLAVVALANNALDEADGLVRLVRARARNRNMVFAGTTVLSEVARRRAGEDPAAQQRAVEGVLRELPKARFGSATVVFQLYQAQAQLDARVEQTRQQMVSPETARGVLWFSEVMPGIVRNRERFLAAVTAVRAELDRQPAEPDYDFHDVDLARFSDARDVNVAVWDVGTNPELFRAQLMANPAEPANGQDDDHDGIVDDTYGIASDPDPAQTALFYNPGEETLRQYSPFLRGVMDLRAGMASTPAAQRVLELQRGVTDAAAARALDQHLDAVGEWAHGTHVAGIMLRGNPRARLAIFRSAWAGESRVYDERGPTDAELDAEAANIDAIAGFINRHHVRVVNASLGFSREYVEDSLRHERALYRTDADVRARAEVVQERRRANWQRVFTQCPQTLFVVAAGNSNQDVMEYGEVPASNNGATNLLVVGAVDRFGHWATFTNSNPERVQVFDHGVEVDSLVPSGEHVPLSGTSMASPNVANLAGKLAALDPALTPERLITVIRETGRPIAAPFNGRITDEAAAVARVRRERRPIPRGGAAAPARPA
ncbi:MAG: Serine protease, subtilase family, partial [Myxococcaceae bacterium]|nr:Serine protease, subtilase family [Myxococcaceae bacterium]